MYHTCHPMTNHCRKKPVTGTQFFAFNPKSQAQRDFSMHKIIYWKGKCLVSQAGTYEEIDSYHDLCLMRLLTVKKTSLACFLTVWLWATAIMTAVQLVPYCWGSSLRPSYPMDRHLLLDFSNILWRFDICLDIIYQFINDRLYC